MPHAETRTSAHSTESIHERAVSRGRLSASLKAAGGLLTAGWAKAAGGLGMAGWEMVVAATG